MRVDQIYESNYLNKQKRFDKRESLQRLCIRNLQYQGSTMQFKFSLIEFRTLSFFCIENQLISRWSLKPKILKISPSIFMTPSDSFAKFDERDPDTKFLYDITKSIFETSYFKTNKVKPYLRSTQYLERLNFLHVNIGSIKRNFQYLKSLLEECEFVFNIICVSETWCSNSELQNNLKLSLRGFDSIPYERSKRNRRRGVLIFIKKNLS